MCCKTMEVYELKKPPGVWCSHCTIGKGCKIYGEHPPTCQGFRCQWLLNPAIADGLRPDRSKVVLTSDDGGTRLIAHCDPATPIVWKKEPMYSCLKAEARHTWGSNLTVVARAGRRIWVIAPTEDLDLGEIDPRSPYVIDQRADGRAEVRVLPPIAEDQNPDEVMSRMRKGLRRHGGRPE